MLKKAASCAKCSGSVDLKSHPHVCPIGHAMCENCNEIVKDFCFECGGKTDKNLPDGDINVIFKESLATFLKKINDSSTLVLPEANENGSDYQRRRNRKESKITVIGFAKWPRHFFQKIPNPDSNMSFNDRRLLRILPTIIKDEDESSEIKKPLKSWESFPKSFKEFKMSHDIMRCPITRCSYPICNTDATHHLLLSHENLPIEILKRYSIGSFQMNTLYVRKNEIRCLMRLLIPGVIKDLDQTKCKDHLPLYLLYTRVNILDAEEDDSEEIDIFSEVFDNPELDDSEDLDYLEENPWTHNECLIIWCAGVIPLDHTINIALSVYPNDQELMNLGALTKVMSLQEPQHAYTIYKTTDRLVITTNDLQRLIDKEMTFAGQIRIM